MNLPPAIFLLLAPQLHLQFEQQANLLLAIVVGVVELNEARVSQRIHDFHLAFHVDPVGFLGSLDELGGQSETRILLVAGVHRSELAPIFLQERTIR